MPEPGPPPPARAPAVDVVIPTRNRPELVARAVRSALGQTGCEMRVFVVDAGGGERLELPADLGADTRVTLLRTPGPSFAGEARNAGIVAGTAPYVAFLDDDDEWLPEKSERQLRLLARLPERIALVACGFRLERRDGPASQHLPDLGQDLRRRLLVHPVFAPSTVIMRRSAMEALPPFADVSERTQDWHYWLFVADRFDAAVLPEVLVRRRDSATSPELLLEGHREMHRLVSERIDALPPRERERAHARHLFDQGVLEARCGRRREARRLLLRAFARDPRTLLPLAHLVRTLIGEPVWQRGARLRLRLQARRAG